MKITSKLAIQNIIKKRRNSFVLIFSVMLVFILLSSIFQFIFQYQQYPIAQERLKGNWEAFIYDVSYDELQELYMHENIEQISIIKDHQKVAEEGKALHCENPYNIHFLEYDKNAMDNYQFYIVDGRLPQNDNEVVIFYTGENKLEYLCDSSRRIILNIDGKYKPFDIVGIVNFAYESPYALEFFTTNKLTFTVISMLDNKKLLKTEKVNISTLSHQPKNIYTDLNQLYPEKKILYNESLLQYENTEGVEKSYTAEFFIKQLHIYSIFFICVSLLMSIILISTIISTFINERKRDFSKLKVLGASDFQIITILFKELTIYIMISIFIGMIVSEGISSLWISAVNYLNEYVNNLELKNYQNPLVLEVIHSWEFLFISIITTLTAVILPSISALIQLNKKNVIEGMQYHTTYFPKKNKTRKKRSILYILTNNTIAFNKKRGTYFCITLTTLIILVIMLVGYIHMQSKLVADNENIHNYILSVTPYNQEIIDEILLKAENNNIIQWVHQYREKLGYITSENGMECLVCYVDEEILKNYLNSINVNELNERECVVINSNIEKNTFENTITIADTSIHNKENLSEEDKGILNALQNMLNSNNHTVADESKQQILTVIEVTDRQIDILNSNHTLTILVTKDTFESLFGQDNLNLYYIRTNDIISLNNLVNETNNTIRPEYLISTSAGNLYEVNLSRSTTQEILSYMFLGLISVICMLNINKIIQLNLENRKEMRQKLRIVGISELQLCKLLFYEYGTYILISCVLGTILGICGEILVYLFFDLSVVFQLPILEIIIAIIAVVIVTGVTIILELYKEKKEKMEINFEK